MYNQIQVRRSARSNHVSRQELIEQTVVYAGSAGKIAAKLAK
ncbi:hypothetical protein [Pelotomaculum schinkii]|nr:hypothetical protein [Pelotomaculum schinkii]